jgi:hypothetical protein
MAEDAVPVKIRTLTVKTCSETSGKLTFHDADRPESSSRMLRSGTSGWGDHGKELGGTPSSLLPWTGGLWP